MASLTKIGATVFLGMALSTGTALADTASPFTEADIQTLRNANALEVCSIYEAEQNGAKRIKKCEARTNAPWKATMEAYSQLHEKFNGQIPAVEYGDLIFTPLSRMTEKEYAAIGKIRAVNVCKDAGHDRAEKEYMNEVRHLIIKEQYEEAMALPRPDYRKISDACTAKYWQNEDPSKTTSELKAKYGEKIISALTL